MAAFTGILKSTICFLRIVRKNDNGINFFIAGGTNISLLISFWFFKLALAGGLSLFIQPKSNRTVWGTFLIARAFVRLLNENIYILKNNIGLCI